MIGFRDSVDGDSDIDVADSPQEETDAAYNWKSVAKLLQGDISRIVTLDQQQLEVGFFTSFRIYL